MPDSPAPRPWPRRLAHSLVRRLPFVAHLVLALDQARAAAAAARQAAAAAREKLARQDARITRLQQRLARAEASKRAMKRHAWARARQQPSPLVLEQVLPARLRALTASARVPQARALAERFARTSAAYADAAALGDQRVDGCLGPVEVGGLRWWIPRQVDGDEGLSARVQRGWLPLTEFVRRRDLAVGAIMLDVGANIGTTAIPRVVLGDFQTVYCAEPDPANYRALVHNVIANGLEGFVLPDLLALGAAAGEVMLGRSPRIGGHRIATTVHGQLVDRGFVDTVRVPCRTLDEWVTGLGIDLPSVAYIKCDVQGWETQVLRGAAASLRHRHIVWELEVSPKHLREAGSSLEELCELVAVHFTHVIDLRGDGPRQRPVAELHDSLRYLGRGRAYTDILAYNA